MFKRLVFVRTSVEVIWLILFFFKMATGLHVKRVRGALLFLQKTTGPRAVLVLHLLNVSTVLSVCMTFA